MECVINESQLKDEIAVLKKLPRLEEVNQQFKSRRSSFEPNYFFESSKLSRLLEWCREVCAIYGISVHNFSSSFSDGRVLCYLIHHYHPSLLNREKIKNITTSNCLPSQDGSNLPESQYQENWSKTFSPTCGIDKQHKHQLDNEKSNFKLVAESLSVLGGVPLLALSKDMSNTLPNEKIVITYVSYLCSHLLLLRKEITAARRIQSAWRKFVTCRKREDNKKNSAATLITSVYKGYVCRKQYNLLKTSCIKLQRMFRVKFQSKKNRAAFVIQAWFHGFVVRKHYLQLRQSALLIQHYYRKFLIQETRKNAALIILNCYQAYKQRKLYLKKKYSAIIIQRQYRRYIANRKHKKKIAKCITLQAFVRARQAKYKFRQKKLAVLSIQRFYRGYQTRRHFLQMRKSCIVIQAWFKSVKLMQMQRATFLRYRIAAKTIQRFFKGFVVRKNFMQIYTGVICIQRFFRSYLWTKQCCAHYLKLKRSVSYIQSKYRAKKAGKLQLNHYQNKRQAVIIMQRYYRAYILQKSKREEY